MTDDQEQQRAKGEEMSTVKQTFGDRIVTGDEVNEAAYSIFSEIGLPFGNEEAFKLRDAIAAELSEALDADMLEPDDFAETMADWPSGCGIISVYTATQVEQWAAMGLWACDMWADFGEEPEIAESTITERIGNELAHVAYRLAYAMAIEAAGLRDEDA